MAKDDKAPSSSTPSPAKVTVAGELGPSPAHPVAAATGDDLGELRAGLGELADWLAGRKPVLSHPSGASQPIPGYIRSEMAQRGQALQALIGKLPKAPGSADSTSSTR